MCADSMFIFQFGFVFLTHKASLASCGDRKPHSPASLLVLTCFTHMGSEHLDCSQAAAFSSRDGKQGCSSRGREPPAFGPRAERRRRALLPRWNPECCQLLSCAAGKLPEAESRPTPFILSFGQLPRSGISSSRGVSFLWGELHISEVCVCFRCVSLGRCPQAHACSCSGFAHWACVLTLHPVSEPLGAAASARELGECTSVSAPAAALPSGLSAGGGLQTSPWPLSWASSPLPRILPVTRVRHPARLALTTRGEAHVMQVQDLGPMWHEH